MLSILMVDDVIPQTRTIHHAQINTPSYNKMMQGSNLAESDALALSHSDPFVPLKEEQFHLGFWDKLGLMAVGTTIVCVTLCIVVCTVGPGCCIYNWLGTNIAE